MNGTTTKNSRTRTMVALLSALLAAILLALVAGTKPAEATFPGVNGKIAFYNNGDVWSMNPDGTGRVQLTTNYNAEDNPAFSPDGSRIAYEFLRGIWLMNADGSGKKALTDGASTDEDPAFSADGTSIIFSRNGDIWEINVDGSGLRNLTQTATFSERDPASSPDGGRIAYTRVGCAGGAGSGGTCIYVMNANGSGQTNLTPENALPECPNQPGYYHNGTAREPSWSPDGGRIAFSGSLICPNTSGKDIWVMNADGSGKTNLINDNGTGDQRFVFSPDGAKILFESDRDNSSGRLELYTVGSTTGGAITRLTFNDIWEGNADWAPVSPRRDIKGTVLGETISGTPGNDTLIGVAGRDTLNGGTGTDTASFAGSTTPVAASLASGFASRTGTSPLTGVAPVGIENLTGSSLSDSLTGSGAVNSLVGGTGADKLYGLAGNDILNSRDSVNGNDSLDGGTGTNQCVKDTTEAAIKACE